MLGRVLEYWLVTFKRKYCIKSHLESSKMIRSALKKISSYDEAEKESLSIRLNNPAFWQALLTQNAHDDSIQAWHNSWQQLAPYAHLTTCELLSLWRHEIFLIESACEWNLHVDQTALDNDFFKDVVKTLAVKKTQILNGLKFRALMAAQFDLPDDEDDVLKRFEIKLHEWGVLEKPLDVKENIARTLNHDRRIEIVDILKSVEDALTHSEQAAILQFVPKKGVSSPSSTQDRAKAISLHQQHFKKLIMTFQRKSHWFDRAKAVVVKWQTYGWGYFKKMTQSLLGAKWLRWVETLYRFRFIIYMALSLSLYGVLMNQCQLLIFHLLTTRGINMLSQGLFYIVGLMPLWMQGGQWLGNAYNWFIERILLAKQHQLIDALIYLDYQKKMLQAILMRTIVDVPRYDIEEIHQSILSAQKQAQFFVNHLSRFGWFEKQTMSESFRQSTLLCLENCSAMSVQYKQAGEKIAQYLVHRVAEVMTQLDVDSDGHAVPMISLKQLSKLKHFVTQFGRQTTIQQLESVLDLPSRWIQSLQVEPYLLNQQSLNGWEILFRYYPYTPHKSKACLDLMESIRKKPAMQQNDLWSLVYQQLGYRSDYAKYE